MPFDLDPEEARVLGALIEKDMSTPEYYPLSLNALTNACNQKNNRDPVTAYEQAAVSEAVDRLRHKGLAVVITGGDNRVPKYAHRIGEKLNLGNRELAVIAVLLLRGPQTPGELRSRTQSLHSFDDLDTVIALLDQLAQLDPEPLVKQLPRQPGSREVRYMHLLSGDAPVEAAPGAAAPPPPAQDRLSRLEAEVESLRREVGELVQELARFRSQFE